MSFLLVEDETLADALAFIDTFTLDEDDVDFGYEASSDTSSSSGSDSPLYVQLRLPPTPGTAALATTTPLKRIYPNPASPISSMSDSSGSGSGSDDVLDGKEHKKLVKMRAANSRAVDKYRKRNKSEILELREQVLLLNAHLAQLRKSGAVDSSRSGRATAYTRTNSATKLLQLQTAPSPGFTEAVSEYKKLQASEVLNHKLKHALAKQRSIHAALGGIFQKQISKNDLSFVLDIEKKLQKKPKAPKELVVRDNRILYVTLFHYLKETVYRTTHQALAQLSKGDVDCVFNNTMSKQDPKLGNMLEFMSSAPIACDLKRIDALLWSHLTNPNGDNSTADMTDETPLSERQLMMNFVGTLGDVPIDGMTAVRKFVEPHRIVFAFTTLLVPVGSGVLIRENGWVIISEAQVSGCTTAPTLFQTFYRLFVEPQSTGVPMLPGETAKLCEYVLNAQGEKMRQYQLMIQSMLLQQFDRIQSSGLMLPCTAVECET